MRLSIGLSVGYGLISGCVGLLCTWTSPTKNCMMYEVPYPEVKGLDISICENTTLYLKIKSRPSP